MARDCPNCSTQNIDGARFCRSCGTVLQPSSPATPTSIIDPAVQSSDLHTSSVQYPGSSQYQNSYTSPFVNPPPIAPIVPAAPDYGPNFQGYNPYLAAGPRYTYAGFGSRFLAYFIDQLIFIFLVFPSYVVWATVNDGRHGPEPISILIFMGALLINFIYWMINVYLLGQNGASIGKRIAGIKCLGPDGQPLGFGKAFLREFVKSAMANFCWIMLFVDNLWMLGDAEKQTLHDKSVSTHVFKP